MAKYQGTIRERMVALVAEELQLTREEIVDESEIERDLGADSLDRTEIIMECEDEFGITIHDDDCQAWSTFADMLATVERLVAEQA